MKSMIFSVIALSFLLLSCSKKEETKLELFSTEAFTFDTGSGWEVNVSTRVKGFEQSNNNGRYNASLAYTLDLIKPSGDTVKALIDKVEDKSEGEKIADTPIEAQFDLDSTYAIGNYTVVVNVKDVASGKTARSSAKFDLQKD